MWIFLQQLWLCFMFLVLAVLELESKAQKRLALGERGCLEALSTLILVSLSPILCQALALAIGRPRGRRAVLPPRWIRHPLALHLGAGAHWRRERHVGTPLRRKRA